MSDFWSDYPKIKKQLVEVELYMLAAVADADDTVKTPITEVIAAGGKRLRPALVILGAQLGKYSAERIIPIAASVELLHTATLIHDDIIDEAALRRGVATVKETEAARTRYPQASPARGVRRRSRSPRRHGSVGTVLRPADLSAEREGS